MMNLHNIVRGAIQSNLPDEEFTLYRSLGQVKLSLNMLLRLKYHVNTYAFDDCVRELNVVVDELRNHVGVN